MNTFASFTALLIVALGYGAIVPLAPTLVTSMRQLAVEALSLR